MKVREERILADRRLAKAGGRSTSCSRACWEETLDAGPYDFGDKTIDWGKVLQGDRFFALLQVRALTYGPEYAFAVPCQNEACRARIEWELDLRELPYRPLCDESRRRSSPGTASRPCCPTRASGSGSGCSPAPTSEAPAAPASAGDKLLSAMLAFRVVEVEGVEAREPRKFIEDLTMRDADFLVDEFDRVDCGVDTTIEIECPECFVVQEIELPFERTFFMPGRRMARRRDRSSSFLG
jgi:hypothetical protein